MDNKSGYNPFDTFRFDDRTCFLTGEPLQKSRQYTVFPEWILDQFGLRGQSFKMLDESMKLYDQLRVPCTPSVQLALQELDLEVHEAMQRGYIGVKSLDEKKLFQWIAFWVYGIVFNEIQIGIRQQMLSGEALNFSQVLAHKFANLHKMLQSIMVPTDFETINPFSIHIFPVDNSADFFNYRDEINTLVFSLRMKDFGLIACLQDNGTNGKYHADVLAQIDQKELHPIQFEEICARFFYSCYLFNRLPEYMISPIQDIVYIEPMPLAGMDSRPIFDHWQNKTYAQVLENFWKPWGFTLFEILKDPENPMSFIYDTDGSYIPSGNIPLAKS